MHVRLRLFVTLLLFSSLSWGESLREKDLVDAHEKNDWQYVIDNGYRLPFSERSEDFERVVQSSIIELLKYLREKNNSLNAVYTLDFVFFKYSSMIANKTIQESFKKTSIILLEGCHKNNWRSGLDRFCVDFFNNHFTKLPNDGEYLFKVAELLRRSNGPSHALKFFDRSLKLKYVEDRCVDDGVIQSYEWGMSRIPPAPEAVNILFSHCWPAMKDDLLDETIQKRGEYLKNICSNLKIKNATLPKNNKCH